MKKNKFNKDGLAGIMAVLCIMFLMMMIFGWMVFNFVSILFF